MFENKLVIKKKSGKGEKVILDLTEGVIDSLRPNIASSDSIKTFIFDNLELLRNLDIKENVINQLKNKVTDVITDTLVKDTKARNPITIFETTLEIKESFSDNKFELTYKLEIPLKNGMRKASVVIAGELEKNSKTISTKSEIAQVASISAQDSEVGDIIAEAMDRVGKN
jgi:hypothetical protein